MSNKFTSIVLICTGFIIGVFGVYSGATFSFGAVEWIGIVVGAICAGIGFAIAIFGPEQQDIKSEPPESFKYCRTCGRKMRIDAAFCPECGTPVKEKQKTAS